MKKIICFYHCPCLDGAFSALTLFAFVKSINENNLFQGGFNELFQRLLDYPQINLEKNTDNNQNTQKQADNNEENIENPNKNNESDLNNEIACNKEKNANKIMEEEKNDDRDIFETFFNKIESFRDFINFFGVKPSQNGEDFQSLIHSMKNKINPEATIMILLDYYGENLENLVKLASLCSKIIIIDHHQSFFDLFASIQPNNQQKIQIFGSILNSACVLTYEFLNKLLGNLIPEKLSSRLLKILPYIEDHDIRSRKFKETEAIVSSFHQLIIDFSIYSNPMLFTSLIKYDVSILIELGTPILVRKMEKMKKFLHEKKKFKAFIDSNTMIQGFARKLQNYKDKDIINELGEALAEASLKEKMDNVGVVYMEFTGGVRVSIRGLNTVEDSPCLNLAKSIGGGGHKFAAGGIISTKILKKWLKG